MAKTNNIPAPRRPSEPRIVDAIGPAALTIVSTPPKPPAPTVLPEAAPASGFAKLSLSVATDLARALRIAAVVEHNVSESALVEVALRRFLELPAAEQSRALVGVGRRRKKQ
jgi:hypothetical protein